MAVEVLLENAFQITETFRNLRPETSASCFDLALGCFLAQTLRARTATPSAAPLPQKGALWVVLAFHKQSMA
ncbi:hypothetical protein [Comamonas sp.]